MEFKKCICGNFVNKDEPKCNICGLRFITGKAFFPSGKSEPQNTMILPTDPTNTASKK